MATSIRKGSRETLETRRELLLLMRPSVTSPRQPLFATVQLQLARCYAALGVDSDAIAQRIRTWRYRADAAAGSAVDAAALAGRAGGVAATPAAGAAGAPVAAPPPLKRCR